MSSVDIGSSLQVTQRQFRVASVTATTLLLLLCTAAYVARDAFGYFWGLGLVRFLDVGTEESLPTLFATLNLLLGALLAYFVYRSAALWRRSWLALSLLLLYMGVDEACQIHESLVPSLLPRVFGPDGQPMQRSWLPFGIGAVLVVGILFLPFLRSLPRATARSFFVACLLFLTGAVAFELIGNAMLHRGFARTDLIYNLRRIVEEGLEMYGIVILNVALFRTLAEQRFEVRVKLLEE